MIIQAKHVRFDEYNMWVELSDARTLGIPLVWFPKLMHATVKSREKFEISARGIHWDELNEDISIEGLLLLQSKSWAKNKVSEDVQNAKDAKSSKYLDEFIEILRSACKVSQFKGEPFPPILILGFALEVKKLRAIIKSSGEKNKPDFIKDIEQELEDIQFSILAQAENN